MAAFRSSVVLVALSALAQLCAQSDLTVAGRVTDSSGAAVAAAEIHLSDARRTVSHNVTTASDGKYEITGLAPGTYEVTAESASGTSHNKIRLVAGTATLDFVLGGSTGSESDSIGVVSKGISLQSGAVAGLVDKRQIRDLPLNGRSLQQLVSLQPGVSVARTAGNDVVGGRGPKLTINGARPEQISYLLDGTEINNVYGKIPGDVAGQVLGIDAVLEFVANTSGYSAEYGRSAGGVVSYTTRSGGARMHGSAYEFLRNSAMDSKNFFDPAMSSIPAFKRNQFGGDLGGPVCANRTFFFAGYESLIERLGVTGVANVANLDVRNGILNGQPIAVNPFSARLIGLMASPNGSDLGSGVAQYYFSRPQPTDEQMGFGRIDHRFARGDSLAARYTFTGGSVDRQPTDKMPLGYIAERSRNQYATAEYQRILSPSALNTIRLGFARSTQEAQNIRTADLPPDLTFIPGQPLGFITISGFVTEWGGDYRLPRLDHYNSWQAEDTILWTRGRHSVRLGVQGELLQFNQNSVSQAGGVLKFSSFESFLRGAPSGVDLTLPGYDPARSFRQKLFGFYVQDNVSVAPNLTLNLGARYEPYTVPAEKYGRIASVHSPDAKALTLGNPWFENPSYGNVAPRIAFAWDPTHHQQTLVRGGIGLFYDPALMKYGIFSGSTNPPFTTRISITNPPYPNILSKYDPSKPPAPSIHGVQWDLNSPYLMQFHLGIQHSFHDGVIGTVEYVGSRGVHLFRVADANLAPEMIVNGVGVYQPALGRRNPNFGAIYERLSDAQSFYNSLQLNLTRRFARGLGAQVSYTFSRSVDDASGFNSQDFVNSAVATIDAYDRKADRGLSSFHSAHNVSANWTWDLPFGRSLRGAPGFLFKGWQLSNITSIQSGHPFTVQLGFNRSGNLNSSAQSMSERPNLKPGSSNNPVLGSPDHYFDLAAFELQPANQRGNLGRNTLIGPGLLMIDGALSKSFRFGERTAVAFRAEVFNAPNHPNFAVPSGRTIFTNAAGAIAADAGRITSTVTTSRQVQVGVRLTF